MLNKIAPEAAGLDSRHIKTYIERLNKRQMHMHSVLMMRGNDIIYEGYWAPFDKDYCHRMYSVTKSFVAVAIGLCIEDGLLSLDDRVYDYFPERRESEIDEHVKQQTVRQMLMMSTVGHPCEWFVNPDPDRTHIYFSDYGKRRKPGTIWEYDSAGSQVLSSLVEKLTGKTLFEFLNERIFTHLGTFKDAKILQTPNGDSWGDSALICTTRDLASFARFVMNLGTYNGKRLMNEEFLRDATTKRIGNRWDCHLHAFRHGYGYQIWLGEEGAFAFVGMGDQLAVCIPKYDFIFCCTADNQGNDAASDYIIYELYDCIVENLKNEAVVADPVIVKELEDLTSSLSLFALTGDNDSPWREKINGKTYVCGENQMGLRDFTFNFDNAKSGTLVYTRGERTMELPFLVNANKLGNFPELGYSRERGRVRTTDGFTYKDAVSLAWDSENKIMVFVQIIDEYFGNTTMSFAFNEDEATVQFCKTAEDFLWEYSGQARAKLK